MNFIVTYEISEELLYTFLLHGSHPPHKTDWSVINNTVLHEIDDNWLYFVNFIPSRGTNYMITL